MTNLPEIQTNDYGELSVQLATVGEVVGSDTEGKPIKQNFTEEAFQSIADQVNAAGEPIPVDKDHASMRPGLDRDTESMGWISRLWANAKGLFGWLKFTRKGRELAEDRAYRFLSPSFVLAEDGTPVQLLNAAYTNQPACSGNRPILNNVPNNEDILNMNIDELKALIKSTVEEMNATVAVNAAPAETPTEETKEETACNQCGEEEKKTEETVNETPEEEEKTEVEVETEKETETETPPAEGTTAEEEKEEKEEDDPEKDAVVKLEALNSKPAPLLGSIGETTQPWENLHGQKFFDELKKHPEWMGDSRTIKLR